MTERQKEFWTSVAIYVGTLSAFAAWLFFDNGFSARPELVAAFIGAFIGVLPAAHFEQSLDWRIVGWTAASGIILFFGIAAMELWVLLAR